MEGRKEDPMVGRKEDPMVGRKEDPMEGRKEDPMEGRKEGPMVDQTVGRMEGPMVDRLVACSQGAGCFAIRQVGAAGLMVEAAELLPQLAQRVSVRQELIQQQLVQQSRVLLQVASHWQNLFSQHGEEGHPRVPDFQRERALWISFVAKVELVAHLYFLKLQFWSRQVRSSSNHRMHSHRCMKSKQRMMGR